MAGKLSKARIDWSKRTKEIANELGVSANHISALRCRIGKSRYKYVRAMWAGVDWSKPVRQIATELGYDYRWVYAMRRRMNKQSQLALKKPFSV